MRRRARDAAAAAEEEEVAARLVRCDIGVLPPAKRGERGERGLGVRGELAPKPPPLAPTRVPKRALSRRQGHAAFPGACTSNEYVVGL